MKLDKNKPFGTVHGHNRASFVQNGVYFDGQGNELDPEPPKEEVGEKINLDTIIPTAEVSNAGTFICTVLKGGPVSKSVVYKAADQSNQQWEDVQKAAVTLNIIKYKYKDTEMWKLPEELQV